MKIKIVLIIKDFSIKKGGGEKFSVNLANAFLNKGFAVEVICRSFDEELNNGFVIHQLKYRNIHPSKSVSFNNACKLFLKENDFDIIIGLTQVENCDFYRLGGGILRQWSKIKYNKSLCGTVKKHLSLNYQYSQRLEDSIFYQTKIKKFIVNSKLVKEEIAKFYPLSVDKVSIIENGIDHNLFFPPSNKEVIKKQWYKEMNIKDSDSKIDILFSANNYRRKGLQYILNALGHKELFSKFRLWISGHDNIEPWFRKNIKNKRPLDIQFLGYCSEMPRLYQAMDLFVLPTKYDPCSNACLEAMACGIPVITTVSNGASMYIDKNNGIVLPLDNLSNDLSKSLESLEMNNNLSKMGEAAAKRVSHLSFENTVQQFIDLFSEN